MQPLVPLAALLILTGCAAGPLVTTVDPCPAWIAPIRGSAEDTPATRRQVDWHNLAGEEHDCWSPPENERPRVSPGPDADREQPPVR